MQSVTIYKDRNNGFSLVMKEDGVLYSEVNMAAITKFEIKYKGVYYDSETYPTSFTATDATATVVVQPEPFGLPASSGKGDIVEFIIYSADLPAGLVWSQFILIVKPDAALT